MLLPTCCRRAAPRRVASICVCSGRASSEQSVAIEWRARFSSKSSLASVDSAVIPLSRSVSPSLCLHALHGPSRCSDDSHCCCCCCCCWWWWWWWRCKSLQRHWVTECTRDCITKWRCDYHDTTSMTRLCVCVCVRVVLTKDHTWDITVRLQFHYQFRAMWIMPYLHVKRPLLWDLTHWDSRHAPTWRNLEQCFQTGFNCCWRDSLKPLQSLSLSQASQIENRLTMFFSKLQRMYCEL